MADLERLLGSLPGRSPYPPTPVERIARRGRMVRRRRRGAQVLVATIVVAAAGTGVGFGVAPGGGPRPVTVTAPGPGPNPPGVDAAAWRGNGQIAFVSGGQLFVLGDGGALRAVTGPGTVSAPAWSTDGTWVAFLRTPPSPKGEPYITEPARLWVATSAGTDPHVVSPVGAGVETFAWDPTPGAETVAFSAESDAAGGAQVSLVGVRTGRLTPVVRTRNPATFVWSPSGRSLAVSISTDSRSGPPTGEIRIIPLGGGAPRTAFTDRDDPPELQSWSPDGTDLAFWTDTDASGSLQADGLPLEVLDLDTGRRHVLARTLTYDPWVAWSPDGRTLALVAGGDRSVWSDGKHLELCRAPTFACTTPAQPAGQVALDPTWTSPTTLVVTDAPVARNDQSAPPGTGRTFENAPYGDAAVRAWYGAQRLATATVTAGSPTVSGAALSAGGGAHAPVVTGRGLLYVRRNGLWYLPVGSTHPIEVVDPITAPTSYYGYVDWSSTFAWHR